MRFVLDAFSANKLTNLQRSYAQSFTFTAWMLGQPECPRRVPMRASLEQASKVRDKELERLARSPLTAHAVDG